MDDGPLRQLWGSSGVARRTGEVRALRLILVWYGRVQYPNTLTAQEKNCQAKNNLAPKHCLISIERFTSISAITLCGAIHRSKDIPMIVKPAVSSSRCRHRPWAAKPVQFFFLSSVRNGTASSKYRSLPSTEGRVLRKRRLRKACRFRYTSHISGWVASRSSGDGCTN